MSNPSYSDISRRKPDRSSGDGTVREHSKMGLVSWWYWLTTPVKSMGDASLVWQASQRKARLFSKIALFLIATLAFSLWVFLSDSYMLGINCAEIVVSCGCLYLNRRGKIVAASVVQVISFELTVTCIMLVMSPLSSANVQILDFFVVGELLTVALLPVGYVFLVAFYNSICIWLNMSNQSDTSNTLLALHSPFIALMIHGVGLQLTVAGISLIWAYNAAKAMSSEDKVAKLEDTLMAQQKELEFGIEQILQTHVSIANGYLNARVPLEQDHALWHIARALNNLLARLQRASIAERELQRIERAVSSTVNIIQKADQQRQQPRIPFTQTAIDPLVAAIQGKTFAFTKPLQRRIYEQSTEPVSTYTVEVESGEGQAWSLQRPP